MPAETPPLSRPERVGHHGPDGNQARPGKQAEDGGRLEEMSLGVVMFEDMQASTALKRAVTKQSDEHAFQELRKQHDRILSRIVTRDGAGQIVKWTGDGMISLVRAPSVAVERAIEIQEEMHTPPPDQGAAATSA
ncbi:MAG TPA: hypothetical protein VEM93_05820 [Actinomycetota bacterium]|nr:hypothetical protein [Actinomycetota bacterium]